MISHMARLTRDKTRHLPSLHLNEAVGGKLPKAGHDVSFEVCAMPVELRDHCLDVSDGAAFIAELQQQGRDGVGGKDGVGLWIPNIKVVFAMPVQADTLNLAG